MTNTYLSTANGAAPSLTSHICQFLVAHPNGACLQTVHDFTASLPYWKDAPEVVEETAKAVEILKKAKVVKTNVDTEIFMAD